jgi:endogenous inhibitor of DNA gyrase (YacG/DUF329 family)
LTAASRKCPGCGRAFKPAADSPWRPFCSERCQLIDLGGWLSERHAIPGDELEPDAETRDEDPAP